MNVQQNEKSTQSELITEAELPLAPPDWCIVRGFVIPTSVLTDPALKPGSRGLYSYLWFLVNYGNPLIWGIREIARFMNRSKSSVQHFMDQLRDRGLVEYSLQKGKKARILMIDPRIVYDLPKDSDNWLVEDWARWRETIPPPHDHRPTAEDREWASRCLFGDEEYWKPESVPE